MSIERSIGTFLSNGTKAMDSALKFFENVQNKVKNIMETQTSPDTKVVQPFSTKKVNRNKSIEYD